MFLERGERTEKKRKKERALHFFYLSFQNKTHSNVIPFGNVKSSSAAFAESKSSIIAMRKGGDLKTD